MAGINLSSVILYDRWPGPVNPNLSIPADGWDNTLDCFKTTSANDQPSYPLGTKIMAYSDNSWAPGWYTMIYLMYHSYEAVALYECSKDFSNGLPMCGPIVAGAAGTCQSQTQLATFGDNTALPYYLVSRCVSACAGRSDFSRSVVGGPYALPCWTASSDGSVAATNGYGDAYGWFWIGGVCPARDVTLFDGAGAGVGSTCRGIGACVTGSFATKAIGPLYFENSQATDTGYLTNDISDVVVVAGDISYAPLSIQPIGWSCMTAI